MVSQYCLNLGLNFSLLVEKINFELFRVYDNLSAYTFLIATISPRRYAAVAKPHWLLTAHNAAAEKTVTRNW